MTAEPDDTQAFSPESRVTSCEGLPDATAAEPCPAPCDNPAHRVLWAKSCQATGEVHRLIYHMIDVGHVAQALWHSVLHPNLQRRLGDWMGLDIEASGRLVAFLASLHDLGKASPAFQDHPRLDSSVRQRIKRELKAAGLDLPNRGSVKHSRHEVVSTWALDPSYEGLLTAESDFPRDWAKRFARVLGGHHGAWPAPYLLSATHLRIPGDVGEPEWTVARRQLVRNMKVVFSPPIPMACLADTTENNNAMCTALSGLVSVADWIGSDERNFAHVGGLIPVQSYADHSRRLAELALYRSGWSAVPAADAPFDFQATFGFCPNYVQTATLSCAPQLTMPALVIIEAPMGSGKTEAALSLYATWASRSHGQGLYVAMPTTATSNQMHTRTSAFLRRQHGPTAEPMLIHSRATLPTDGLLGKTEDIGDVEEDQQVTARTWRLPRKGSLLAPLGVGTVDQALLSVLQTKHFFVRLFGLSQKVVIFDEVHAYDSYMAVLFHRLLRWLREMDTSVVVLSATLPERTRREMVTAYVGRPCALCQMEYPRLTYATATGDTGVARLPAPPDRTLALDWIGHTSADIGRLVRTQLARGGCAAIICNTVRRAQRLYQDLERELAGFCGEDNLMLFHARFPAAWREEIENKVLYRFGKDRRGRPTRSVLVATQVIEQSLDLDFDMMISDMAPVDLLLQRAGRLHRHERDVQGATVARRHAYRLWVTLPDETTPVPGFDPGDVAVYERYVLLRSWAALCARTTISLPGDVAELIEAVYDDARLLDVGPEMRMALDEARQEMEKKEANEAFQARERMVGRPDDEQLLWGDNLSLEEDDPTVHTTFQALTRADRPGLSVVCLHQDRARLTLEPNGEGLEVGISLLPGPDIIRGLLERTVVVRHPRIKRHLLAEPSSAVARSILDQWRKVPALRYHRVCVFGRDGICRLGGIPYTLRLTRGLGLEILPEAK